MYYGPRSRSLTVLLAALTVTACQTTPPLHPAPSSLQLMESQSLVLPDACRPAGSVTVDFTVLRNGATDNIRPAAAPECVQQALTAWVSSFRYAPVSVATTATVEWLLVEARKGS
jgi:hypothetical protein